MTNKEAINILKRGYPDINRYAASETATYAYDVETYDEALDLAIKALEDVVSLKRVISLLAIGGIPPEKQLLDFGYTKEDWVYMLKTVMGIIEENISCANSEDIKEDEE